MKEIVLNPVGIVRSEIKTPSLKAHSGDLNRETDETPSQSSEVISEIEIDPQYKSLLDGVEDFSHLLVLYWAHLVKSEGRSLDKVHPMGRKDMPLTGIFATCSPARPNSVLVIAVKLLERNDTVLRVSGLDAVDGSPVIDIKPYLPHYYSVEDATLSPWMNQLIDEMENDKDVSK